MSPAVVLVIDDEEDMRVLATFALELDGLTSVLTARSGAEGIGVARANRPAAILLDWRMPGMDGAATLAALKADEITALIPVVVLSGAAHDSDADTFHRLGALGVIAKPFDPMTLAARLRSLLSTPRSAPA